ncbi:MAG: hypothetical protein LC772_12160, partial [Chloroflexi bacterium]|nr:hypothetical protein [Chloroflexota bacterium]
GHTAPRVFAPGQYWSGSFNTPIAAYYKRHGKAELGQVYDNGPGAAVHNWKVGDYSADVQDFKGGTHKELDVFATNTGAYEINNVHGFWTYYIHTGGLGHYGLPLNNEHRFGRGQYRQDFQNSSLIWNPRTGIWEQHRALSGGRI